MSVYESLDELELESDEELEELESDELELADESDELEDGASHDPVAPPPAKSPPPPDFNSSLSLNSWSDVLPITDDPKTMESNAAVSSSSSALCTDGGTLDTRLDPYTGDTGFRNTVRSITGNARGGGSG